ncbi:MAG: hypothetical protein LC624_00395 [Halobacteriales archaeon]|nr:hypothetical protein [Halobacteriales archaeon]
MRILALGLLLLAPGALAANGHFDLVVEGREVAFRGSDANATVVRNASDDLALSIASSQQRLVGNVTVRGWDVERVEQVVPRVDGACFESFAGPGVEGALRGASVANVSGTPAEVRIVLAFPRSFRGASLLELARDVAPPTVDAGPAQNITATTFDVRAGTSEDATGKLVVLAEDGSAAALVPTFVRATAHGFQAQRLSPGALYRWHTEFEDCAGNTASSAEATLHTLGREPARTPSPAVLGLLALAMAAALRQRG